MERPRAIPFDHQFATAPVTVDANSVETVFTDTPAKALRVGLIYCSLSPAVRVEVQIDGLVIVLTEGKTNVPSMPLFDKPAKITIHNHDNRPCRPLICFFGEPA